MSSLHGWIHGVPRKLLFERGGALHNTTTRSCPPRPRPFSTHGGTHEQRANLRETRPAVGPSLEPHTHLSGCGQPMLVDGFTDGVAPHAKARADERTRVDSRGRRHACKQRKPV